MLNRTQLNHIIWAIAEIQDEFELCKEMKDSHECRALVNQLKGIFRILDCIYYPELDSHTKIEIKAISNKLIDFLAQWENGNG